MPFSPPSAQPPPHLQLAEGSLPQNPGANPGGSRPTANPKPGFSTVNQLMEPCGRQRLASAVGGSCSIRLSVDQVLHEVLVTGVGFVEGHARQHGLALAGRKIVYHHDVMARVLEHRVTADVARSTGNQNGHGSFPSAPQVNRSQSNFADESNCRWVSLN